MECMTRRIRHTSRTDVFTLWFLGDLHIGSAACDEDAIRRTVRAIADDPNALWIGLGDMAEYIPRSDWRFRQSRLAPWLRGLEADYCDDIVAAQIERLVAVLSPIADKSLGALTGNHEDKMLARFERDVHGEMCRRLQIANLSDEAMIRLAFTRYSHVHTVDVYVHHGWFASRKSGAKVNNLHDMFLTWDVDIIAVGHGHERVVAPAVWSFALDKAGNLVSRRRIALMTGSFLRAHVEGATSYASAKGYRATDVGAVSVVIRSDGSLTATV